MIGRAQRFLFSSGNELWRSTNRTALRPDDASIARRVERFADREAGPQPGRGAWLRSRLLDWRVAAVVGAGGAYAYVSSREVTPFTHRTHGIWVSAATERSIGERSFDQVHKGQLGPVLPPNHRASVTVRNIMRELVHVLEQEPGGGAQRHLKGLEWEAIVVESPQVNAAALPGGKIFVCTGLLDQLRSRDELAGVLAHEVAHVVARHGAERLGNASLGLFLTFIVMYVGLSAGLPIHGSFHQLMQLMWHLPNSRLAETEADTIGLQLAARACFDPEGMMRAFQKIEAIEARMAGAKQPEMLRTHPLTATRIKEMKEQMPDALMAQELAGCSQKRELLLMQGFS